MVAYKKERAALALMQQVIDNAVCAMTQVSGSRKLVFPHDFGIEGKMAKNISIAYGKHVKDKALFLSYWETRRRVIKS